jgi:sugar lactone lactonase YvrE
MTAIIFIMKNSLFAFILFGLCSLHTIAGGPSVWSVNSRADVLKGDPRGMSVDQNGTLTLAPKLTEVFKSEQQYIWSSTVDTAGNVFLGTGGDGKIFKITAGGTGALFADLNEMNVTSLAIGRSGELFAATSPDGKVYRLDSNGKPEVYFEPQEKYIWSLAVLSDGLAVATGDRGKIYKVRAANASLESSLLFDTSETNIISLATDKQGNLYAGTDSNGLVMRFGSDGKPFGLLDSPLREIHELAIGADGSVYALALGESASAPAKAEAAAAATPETKAVIVNKPSANPEPAPKSRYDLTGAKTAVYRILPDGSVDLLWTSAAMTGFSIYAHQTGNGVLLGTSDKGRIYNVANDGSETLVLQTDANQISTIKTYGRTLLATSSNAGTLFRFGPDTVTEGTYDSAVLDAKTTATWGRIWWRSTGGVAIQTRSGNTENADETWSRWSSPLTLPSGGQIASPKARYLQWRAVLRNSPVAGSLNEVSLAFAPRNIAPQVLAINVLPTNVGLAANPPVQIDPNIELSGLEPATFGIPSTTVPPRRVYQRGATSLQWTAEDRNGDKLVYDIYYKEVGEANFRPLREGISDNFMAIDGQALADGRYVFKIIARDTPSNPLSLALAGEKLTEPIDNTAPIVRATGAPQITGDRARVTFEATDTSYITRAEYSIDGGDWSPLYADDGISDGPGERFTLEMSALEPGERTVTIRVYDVNGNSGNARAVIRK